MDGTVTDFFNEIDQIAPPKEQKEDSVWQECYDNSSGYAYYWNIKTDEVTWEMPEEYKLWKERNSPNKSGSLYVPPKSVTLFPSAVVSTTKIYKIQADSQSITQHDRKPTWQKYPSLSDQNNHTEKSIGSSKDTEEKVVLISSYDNDSDSENESEKQTRTVNINNETAVLGPHLPHDAVEQANLHSDSQSNSDNEDDTDLLTQIQNRAKVLRDLGGELPPDVKKLVEENGSDEKKEFPQTQIKKEKKDVTSFSLVAGYGDSDEEEEVQTPVASSVPSSFPDLNENKSTHSTLFPIAEPIDIRQFSEIRKEPETSQIHDLVDSKVFHRKRRIGIDFASKKIKVEVDETQKFGGFETERQGLGFKSEKENEPEVTITEAKTDYPGFKCGGVMFVKSDVLSPSSQLEKKEQKIKEDDNDHANEVMSKIEETHKTLNEKLTFLSEGREPASPVQIMIIQMETLYEAMKVGSLTVSYLHKWLKETCSELVKLEKDAAPSGWLLKWDRLNKRYYYRNQQSGDSQWEYPQPDIVGGDEAMDISTTPPPVVDDMPSESVTSAASSTSLSVQPPPPPRIRSPTPPPPPTISKHVKQKKKSSVKLHTNPPLPVDALPDLPPLPPEKVTTHGEPLPPGVDSAEVAPFEPSLQSSAEEKQKSHANDVLGPLLDSFYSDLAALETEANTLATAVVPQQIENEVYINTASDVTAKKKKKTKVKLVQGLAMKKKGVSKLVERWKNVQKDYN